MENTICLLNDFLGIREQQNITTDLNLFVALILDCTAVDLNLSKTQRDDFLSKFESVARGMCYALHCKKNYYSESATVKYKQLTIFKWWGAIKVHIHICEVLQTIEETTNNKNNSWLPPLPRKYRSLPSFVEAGIQGQQNLL